MHTKDGTSISLGTYKLLVLPPPRFDHTQHWPDFPLTLQIPGEPSRESKMTFLNDAQAAPRSSGDPHHRGHLWTDPDPIRRRWVVEMFHEASAWLLQQSSGSTGHIKFEGKSLACKVCRIQGGVTSNEGFPVDAGVWCECVQRIGALDTAEWQFGGCSLAVGRREVYGPI